MTTPSTYRSSPTSSPPPASDSMWQHILEGVRTQIEYYFSVNNLAGDPYLTNLLACEPVGAVPVTLIAGFPKVNEWYQYYLSFHNTNYANKKPWLAFYLVAEALKTSETVHVTPDGFLVPDAWRTMEAMRQRQYASPVPTSVSSQQSSSAEMSSSSPRYPPPHRFFYPIGGGFDPNNNNNNNNNNAMTEGNNAMPYQQHPVPSAGFPPVDTATYYPEDQMQYGFVAGMQQQQQYPYEMAAGMQSIQPLIGNYVGYDNAPPPQLQQSTTTNDSNDIAMPYTTFEPEPRDMVTMPYATPEPGPRQEPSIVIQPQEQLHDESEQHSAEASKSSLFSKGESSSAHGAFKKKGAKSERANKQKQQQSFQKRQDHATTQQRAPPIRKGVMAKSTNTQQSFQKRDKNISLADDGSQTASLSISKDPVSETTNKKLSFKIRGGSQGKYKHKGKKSPPPQQQQPPKGKGQPQYEPHGQPNSRGSGREEVETIGGQDSPMLMKEVDFPPLQSMTGQSGATMPQQADRFPRKKNIKKYNTAKKNDGDDPNKSEKAETTTTAVAQA